MPTIQEKLGLPPPEPVSLLDRFLWIALVAPVAVTSLVQFEGTKRYRVQLWSVGTLATCWVLITSKMDSEALPYILLFFIFGTGLRYAIIPSPPKHHPLPRRPPLAFLRRSTLFNALDLLFNPRLINITPSSPLPKSPKSSKGYFGHLIHHFVQGTIHLLLLSLTYPINLLVITHPSNQGYASFKSFAKNTGLPGYLVSPILAFTLAWTTYHSLCFTWHLIALVGIGSGIYIGEEWPKLENRPWRSESQIEFWGKRFHQLLRELIVNRAKPYIPKSLTPLIPFTYTALLHTVAFLPITQRFNLAYFRSFTLAALGCIIERSYYKYTGSRVGGLSGRLWTWIWIFGVVLPFMTREWFYGGMEGFMRKEMKIGLDSNPLRAVLDLMGLREGFENWLLSSET